MWWLWSIGVPRRESMDRPLGSLGPLQLPGRLTPEAQQSSGPPPRLLTVAQVGETGQPAVEGDYRTAGGGGAPLPSPEALGRAPGPTRGANPLLNLGLSLGARALGVPGIVVPIISSILNAIIGPARVRVDPTGTGAPTMTNFAPTDFGQLLREGDPWATGVADARAESAARGVRIDNLMEQMTHVDPGDDAISLPGPIDTEAGAYTIEGTGEDGGYGA